MATGLGDEVAWYCPSLNDSPNDISGNGNSGTYKGGMGTVNISGEGGTRAYDFGGSGSGQYISLPPSIVANTSPVTVCGWVRVNSTTNQALISDYDSTSDDRSLYFGPRSNGIKAIVSANGTNTPNAAPFAGTTVTVGTWRHVLLTHDPVGGAVEMFIDGSSVATDSLVGRHNTGLNWTIGARNTASTAVDMFDGYADDIRVYDRVLEGYEITHLATARGIEGPAPVGLGDEVAWYCPSLNDSPFDISGNGNNGVYQGGMATVAIEGGGGSRAYDFDGVDDNLFVSVSNNQWYPYEVTRSMWVKSSDTLTAQDYFREYGISANPKLRMQLRHGQTPKLMHLDYNNNTGGMARVTSSGLDVSTGNWTHLAITYKQNGGYAAPTGTDIDIYVNGSLYSSFTGQSPCAPAARPESEQVTHEVNIGVAGGLECQMDDIRIFDRILTETEIAYLAVARGVEGVPSAPSSIDLDYLWSPTQGSETALGPIANIGTAGTQSLSPANLSGLMSWVSDTDKDGLYAIDMERQDNYEWDPFSAPAAPVTTGCWIKCDDADESGYIMSLKSNTSSLFLAAEFRSGGLIRLYHGGSNTEVSDGNITKTDWNHVAITYDETDAKLFLNGMEIASAALSVPSTYNGVKFGTAGGSVFGAEGRMDGMFLAYSILTDSEIATLAIDRTYPYSGGPQPPTGNWHNPFLNSFFYNPFFYNEAL